MQDSSVVDIGQELNRKVMDTMSWLTTSVANGNLTEDQFSVAVDALFMSVSGLAGEEFIDVVTKSKELCAAESRTLRRVFYQDAVVVVMTWQVGSDSFDVWMMKGGETRSIHTIARNDAKSAYQAFKQHGDYILSKGAAEL